MRTILLFATLLIAGCAGNISNPGAEYGFHFGGVGDADTGEYSYLYVTEVACRGPATDKLYRRDVITRLTINRETFDFTRIVPRRRVEEMSSRLAIARYEAEIWIREGGFLGPEKYYVLTPGNASWNPLFC